VNHRLNRRAVWILILAATVVLPSASFRPLAGQAQQPGAGAQSQPRQTPEEAALQAERVGHSVNVPSQGLVVGRRRFEPGKRTYWHSHEKGFILFVDEGRARVQTRGQLMKELKKGEIEYTPPGVSHWHGAAADEAFLQLSVLLGGEIRWEEAVTDAQYNGKSR
jgi:quercetin dioxygenase-like cupin family protein